MTRISLRKRSAPSTALRIQQLDGDGTLVTKVTREIDRGHAATADLAIDLVPAAEGGSERGTIIHCAV